LGELTQPGGFHLLERRQYYVRTASVDDDVGVVLTIYTVLFFPELEKAVIRGAHHIEAKIAAHHKRHQPPFPRPA
jgi:hypothetical protein